MTLSTRTDCLYMMFQSFGLFTDVLYFMWLKLVCAQGVQEFFHTKRVKYFIHPTVNYRHVQRRSRNTCCGRKDLLITNNDSGVGFLGVRNCIFTVQVLVTDGSSCSMVVSFTHTHTNVYKACTTSTHTLVYKHSFNMPDYILQLLLFEVSMFMIDQPK